MSQTDWTDILHIGLPKLDDQHKKLISYSNSLIQAMTRGEESAVLKEIFEELKEYTAYHFADEEKYMRDIGYPYLDEHISAHKALIRRVDEFREQLMSPAEVSPDVALDFINRWVIVHIMEEDSLIGKFAKSL